MKTKLTLMLSMIMLLAGITVAGNIDPYNDGSQYAYGENVGWFNFEPNTGDGVQVASDKLTGFIWAENIGWISLSCENTSTCGTVNYGVTNDGAGNLTGFTWAENVGWINFNPTHGGVTIDIEGNFDGWAYGENIGWIHLSSVSPVSYKVQTCVVTLEDLQNFASYWLQSGSLPANLDLLNAVDMNDYSIFASYWQDFCPDGWQLK